jgi:hypothetical protein
VLGDLTGVAVGLLVKAGVSNMEGIEVGFGIANGTEVAVFVGGALG